MRKRKLQNSVVRSIRRQSIFEVIKIALPLIQVAVDMIEQEKKQTPETIDVDHEIVKDQKLLQ